MNLYFGKVGFIPDSRMPNKAVVFRGQDEPFTSNVEVKTFVLEAENELELASMLLRGISAAMPGDRRPVRGLESLEFLKVKKEDMPHIERQALEKLAADYNAAMAELHQEDIG